MLDNNHVAELRRARERFVQARRDAAAQIASGGLAVSAETAAMFSALQTTVAAFDEAIRDEAKGIGAGARHDPTMTPVLLGAATLIALLRGTSIRRT